jgi:tetratricopeptide (TPR) repeat protein
MNHERYMRAMEFRDQGNEENALRELDALAREASDTEERASLELAQITCLARLGRLEEARQRWHDATRTLSKPPYVDFVDACLCVSEGKTEEALQKLTAFQQNHSQMQLIDPELYSDAEERLGLLLYGMRRFSEAVGPLERALALAKGDANRRRICYYIGSSNFECGDFKAAEPRFAESLLLDRRVPLWAQAQYYLGHIYFKKGAYFKAQRAFGLCECFMDGSDTRLKEEVLSWLAATRHKLSEHSESLSQ